MTGQGGGCPAGPLSPLLLGGGVGGQTGAASLVPLLSDPASCINVRNRWQQTRCNSLRRRSDGSHSCCPERSPLALGPPHTPVRQELWVRSPSKLSERAPVPKGEF